MHDVIKLVFYCCDNLRISVTWCIYGNSTIKVEVSYPFFIVEIHTFCTFRDKIISCIGFYHIFFYNVL